MATTVTDRVLLGQQTAAEYAIERNFAARVWAASGPGRSVGMLVDEQAHWANMQIHTGLELALYLVREDYSDYFKSVYGVRPRWVGFTSLEEAEEGLERLAEEVEDDALYVRIKAVRDTQYADEDSLVEWVTAHAVAKIARENRWFDAAAQSGAEGW